MNIINWHRLFGLALIDLFAGSAYQVELERDMSIKQQFLDVIIVRKTTGKAPDILPDGLDNLAEHNLLTYKSLHEPLDDWALKELTGHYVNYRKQTVDADLMAESAFRLYGIATHYPSKLAEQVELKPIQLGVYAVQRGTDQIRIIVLNTIPKTANNALWHLFSGVPDRVTLGASLYRHRFSDISTIINQLFDNYQLEKINMPYTMEDFHHDYTLEHLHLLTPEERVRGMPTEERLRGLPTEERLRGLPTEELLSGLLRGLPNEERLLGLEEEITRLMKILAERHKPN